MSGPWRDGPDRYGRISIVLHWTTAVLVLALIAMGLLMDWTIGFEDQSLYARIKTLHISTGVLLAALVLPRIAWRLVSGWPRPLPQARPLRFLAELVPRLLLLGILVQAVTGVLARWTARSWPGFEAQSLPFFGLAEIPGPFHLFLPGWNRIFEDVHELTADALMILVGLHVLGAFKHLLLDGGTTAFRMSLGSSARHPGSAAGARSMSPSD